MTETILLVETNALLALARTDRLDVLAGKAVQISDYVLYQLRLPPEDSIKARVLDFLTFPHGRMGSTSVNMPVIETGVPAMAEKLAALGEHPGDASIRRVILHRAGRGNCLCLVSSADHHILSGDPADGMSAITPDALVEHLSRQ